MAEEPDDISMAFMGKFGTRPAATLAGRRERESRPVARSDRNAISSISRRQKQLNLKVTNEFYDRVYALAQNERMSMPDFIEQIVTFWEAHRP